MLPLNPRLEEQTRPLECQRWRRPETLTALPMTPRMVPASAAAMPNRPLLRMFMATLNPEPGAPRTFAAGTRTPSKCTSAVLEALMPIFFSGGPLQRQRGASDLPSPRCRLLSEPTPTCPPGKDTHCVTPPNERSTMNAVILSFTSPVASSFTGVLAKTVNISARPPLLQETPLPRQSRAVLLLSHSLLLTAKLSLGSGSA